MWLAMTVKEKGMDCHATPWFARTGVKGAKCEWFALLELLGEWFLLEG